VGKLAIGSANGLGDPYVQNLQSIYFDANDPNYPALGTLFKLLIAVQNRLMRLANRSAAIRRRIDSGTLARCF
jgi:hypothetical protein